MGSALTFVNFMTQRMGFILPALSALSCRHHMAFLRTDRVVSRDESEECVAVPPFGMALFCVFVYYPKVSLEVYPDSYYRPIHCFYYIIFTGHMLPMQPKSTLTITTPADCYSIFFNNASTRARSSRVSTPWPGISVAIPTWIFIPCQSTRNCSSFSIDSSGDDSICI